MTPGLTRHEGATVLGVDVTTSNAAEADPDKGQIPALWARFYRDDILGKIPGKTTPVVPIAVYTDYDGDHKGEYRLLAGAAVEKGTIPPEGLRQATIPAGSYLVFRAEGEMPGIVIETWKAVWDYFSRPSGHIRAYTADFELYRGPKEVEIHVAVS